MITLPRSKLILFVRKPSQKNGIKSTEALVREKLHENYRIASALTNGLDEQIFDVFPHERVCSDPIVAMITPVPPNQHLAPIEQYQTKYEYCSQSYSYSLNLLSRIARAYPNMPIIAYTRAEKCDEIEKLFQDEGRVKRVVHISPVDRWQEDYLEIKAILQELTK